MLMVPLPVQDASTNDANCGGRYVYDMAKASVVLPPLASTITPPTVPPGTVPIDAGRDFRAMDIGPHTAIVDGDALSYAIAAASIVAKVTRDRLMYKLAVRYPGYGWEHNAGYATAEHRAALRALGVTPFHRRSFAPVREALAGIEQLELSFESLVPAFDQLPDPDADAEALAALAW